jgi:hypothetical protein
MPITLTVREAREKNLKMNVSKKWADEHLGTKITLYPNGQAVLVGPHVDKLPRKIMKGGLMNFNANKGIVPKIRMMDHFYRDVVKKNGVYDHPKFKRYIRSSQENEYTNLTPTPEITPHKLTSEERFTVTGKMELKKEPFNVRPKKIKDEKFDLNSQFGSMKNQAHRNMLLNMAHKNYKKELMLLKDLGGGLKHTCNVDIKATLQNPLLMRDPTNGSAHSNYSKNNLMKTLKNSENLQNNFVRRLGHLKFLPHSIETHNPIHYQINKMKNTCGTNLENMTMRREFNMLPGLNVEQHHKLPNVANKETHDIKLINRPTLLQQNAQFTTQQNPKIPFVAKPKDQMVNLRHELKRPNLEYSNQKMKNPLTKKVYNDNIDTKTGIFPMTKHSTMSLLPIEKMNNNQVISDKFKNERTTRMLSSEISKIITTTTMDDVNTANKPSQPIKNIIREIQPTIFRHSRKMLDNALDMDQNVKVAMVPEKHKLFTRNMIVNNNKKIEIALAHDVVDVPCEKQSFPTFNRNKAQNYHQINYKKPLTDDLDVIDKPYTVDEKMALMKKNQFRR